MNSANVNSVDKSIIYVVTHGDYSDYHICGVFDNQENAEAYREWHRFDAVEKYSLNPSLPAMRKGYNSYSVCMWRNGYIRDIQVLHEPASVEEQTELNHYPVSGPVASGTGAGPAWCLQGVVLARNKEHAVKITNEKRVQLIAIGTWPRGLPVSICKGETKWNRYKS